MYNNIFNIYTNHDGGLYQMYKIEGKPSVYLFDIDHLQEILDIDVV